MNSKILVSQEREQAHYLTIENQEHSRKKAIEEALEAARKAAEREADNSTLAKFIREPRIKNLCPNGKTTCRIYVLKR